MWDSENQRLGMKACTPFGYALRQIGDLIGFFGLILLLLIPCFMVFRFFRHEFASRDWWLLLAPIIVGLIGRVLFMCGWALAMKRKFEYEYKTMTVKWVENGIQKEFPNLTKAVSK